MNWRVQLDKVAALNPFDTVESLQALINLNSTIPPEAHGEYYNCIGIAFSNPKNPKYLEIAASVWFQKAAEAGSAPAAFNLGRSYLSGAYGHIDLPKAKHYLELAHKLGHHMASGILLGVLQRAQQHPADSALGSSVKRMLDADPNLIGTVRQMVEADAARGSPGAMFRLATEHARTNPSITLQYYEKLASGDAQGRLIMRPHIGAALCLGFRYLLGFDVKEDWVKATHHLTRALAAGAKDDQLAEILSHVSAILTAMKTLKAGNPAAAQIPRDLHEHPR